MLRKSAYFLIVSVAMLYGSAASATTCTGTMNTFANGTPANAIDVNTNFTTLLTCANTLLAPLASPRFTGTVGIGTASPTDTLTVLTGGSFQIDIGSSGDTRSRYVGDPSGRYRWWMSQNTASLGTSIGNASGLLLWGGDSSYSNLIASVGNDLALYTGGTTNGNAIERLRILQTGNIGIGTATPARALTVVGDIRVGTSGTNGCLENFGGGNIVGTCSSDAALKNVVGDVTGVLGRIADLQLVKFRWNGTAAAIYRNSTTALNTGFIAQSVERQFPELVSFDVHGYRQLDYSSLSLYGLEAIKELKAENDRQSGEIAQLRARLALTDQRLAALEARIETRAAANNQNTRVGFVQPDVR